MAKYVELRRHMDAEGDVLTPEGVRAATAIGARLAGAMTYSSRQEPSATQTLADVLVVVDDDRGRVTSGGRPSGS